MQCVCHEVHGVYQRYINPGQWAICSLWGHKIQSPREPLPLMGIWPARDLLETSPAQHNCCRCQQEKGCPAELSCSCARVLQSCSLGRSQLRPGLERVRNLGCMNVLLGFPHRGCGVEEDKGLFEGGKGAMQADGC